MRIVLLLSLFLLGIGLVSAQVKHPVQFLPHAPGSQFSRHDQIIAYLDYLAAASPLTLRSEEYGLTYEQRPLKILTFSTPENIANLEQIRTDHLKRSGLAPGEPVSKKKIAIVWLSMSVHGNEPSGTECSPELAYLLATQTDTQIKAWLSNTIVILDPSLNPDGYSRYTNWYRSVSGTHRNTNKISREHNEPWPGGRVNHYQFDLNRDWAWATQTESSARLEIYHKWYPHMHADLHEQGVDNPYYFPPAAEPMHRLITQFQRDFQEVVGKNHASYFDANKWLYFTREWFDLFYPSYGDTYPIFNGSIGMTYEQAGHSTAGRNIQISNGDTLSLYDRVLHHRTTALSTIEVASKNADQLSDEMARYFQKAKAGVSPTKTYLIPAAQDPEKVHALLRLLDKHKIKYGQAGSQITGTGWSYKTGKETNVSIQTDDILISTLQAQSNLLTAFFEASSELADSLTYDITAWSLPYAYGLEVYSLRQMLTPKNRPGITTFTPVKFAAHPYSWIINRGSMSQMRCIGRLLQQGVKVRYANKPFNLPDKNFEIGSFIINHGDNRHITETLDSLVQAEVATAGQMSCTPIFSSWANVGPNFGSENMILIEEPKIALIYGDGIDNTSYGHAWYYFEQDLNFPFTDISANQIKESVLDQFNTLVLTNGSYSFDEAKLATIRDWVKNGGKLICMEEASKYFSAIDGFKWEAASLEEEEKKGPSTGHYHAAERVGIKNTISGAIIETNLDTSHPISAGIGGTYYSLKTNANLFKMDSSGVQTPCWIPEKPHIYGFIGANVKPKLTNTASISVQRQGSGKVILFADNPLFRSFWYQGKVLFGNALFF
jgi:hypothetical protein